MTVNSLIVKVSKAETMRLHGLQFARGRIKYIIKEKYMVSRYLTNTKEASKKFY